MFVIMLISLSFNVLFLITDCCATARYNALKKANNEWRDLYNKQTNALSKVETKLNKISILILEE